MLYTYVIYSQYHDGYEIMEQEQITLCTTEKVSEDEWKSIVTEAFHEVCGKRDDMDAFIDEIPHIAEWIMEKDSRFVRLSSVTEEVGCSRIVDTGLPYPYDKNHSFSEDWVTSPKDEYGDFYALKP